jgi:hypothetical protein
MKPRSGGNLKSHFPFVGNFFDGWIGATIEEMANHPTGEHGRNALSALEVGEMAVLIAHRGHRGSLRPGFDGWPRLIRGGGC